MKTAAIEHIKIRDKTNKNKTKIDNIKQKKETYKNKETDDENNKHNENPASQREKRKLFLVDYCKRSITKCRRCKKSIIKDNLRIGKPMKFKTKFIYHYFHVECAFRSFEKAKSTLNTITCIDDIIGFE